MNENQKLFLITIGTSIIEKSLNDQKIINDTKAKIINKNYLNNEYSIENNENEKINIEEIHNKIMNDNEYENRDKCKNYSNFFKEINSNLLNNNILKNNELIEELKKLSAEMKTLFKIIENKNLSITEHDKFVLYPTLTYSGILCTYLIKLFINKIFNNDNIEIIFTKGLSSFHENNLAEEFVKSGIPNLLNNLYEKIKEGQQDKRDIYIIISGGYKSIVPYSTIIGILTKTKIYYIYEDSDCLIELPELPINLDIKTFKSNYIFIKNLKSSLKDKYYQKLDENIKNLFIKDNSNIIPGPLLNFFENYYSDLHYKLGVDLQASNLNILKYLNNSDLKDKFLKLNEIGPYLWLGDKIPEMVDHALKHHNNLFEIVDIFLSPILDKNNNFLTQEELFILLCAIYLHDIGHTLSYIYFDNKISRKLLPSEIREYHHILGYYRLKNHVETQSILINRLNWINNNSSNIWNEYWSKYFEVISMVGLYHRKNMPLENSESKFVLNIDSINGDKIIEEYEALENKAKNGKFKLNDKDINAEKLKFIVALFRVIDSLDNQFSRVGDEKEFIFKILSLISEIRSELKRLREFEKSLNQTSNNDLLKDLNDKYKKIENGYEHNPPIIIDDEISDFLKKYNNKITKQSIYLYLDYKSSIFMKKNQFKHYLKHIFLDYPIFDYQYVNEHHKIKITFKKSENFDKIINELESILKSIESNKLDEYTNEIIQDLYKNIKEYKNNPEEKLKNIIDKDIKSDYDKVKGILNNKNLEIEYNSSS